MPFSMTNFFDICDKLLKRIFDKHIGNHLENKPNRGRHYVVIAISLLQRKTEMTIMISAFSIASLSLKNRGKLPCRIQSNDRT